MTEPNALQSWLAIAVVILFVWVCVLIERWWNRRQEKRRWLASQPWSRRAHDRHAPRYPGGRH